MALGSKAHASIPALDMNEMARIEALICVLILKAGTVPFNELKIRTRRGHM